MLALAVILLATPLLLQREHIPNAACTLLRPVRKDCEGANGLRKQYLQRGLLWLASTLVRMYKNILYEGMVSETHVRTCCS